MTTATTPAPGIYWLTSEFFSSRDGWMGMIAARLVGLAERGLDIQVIMRQTLPVCRLLGKKCVVRVESPFEMVEPISVESLDMMNGITGRILGRVLKPARNLWQNTALGL